GALPSGWLKQDVAFDTDWQELIAQAAKRPPEENESPRHIFLTGATGFLGGRLLQELLTHTDAAITCLLRDPSRLAVKDSRITTICGDIEQPHFGLSENDWQELAVRIDTVYHCAARVNVVQPYEVLRPANVNGTREVLRLALTGRRKKLHLASTL